MEKGTRLMHCFLIGILVVTMFGAFYNPQNMPPAQGKRTLSLGKIGGDVRQMQIALTQAGYKLQPFDGIYGLGTQHAVLDLQKKNGLKATGIIDKNTRRLIEEKNNALAIDSIPKGFSGKDVSTLARVINGEARGESFEGKVAVAAVVLNRTRSDQFPKSINGVVFQPGAFDAVNDGQIWLEPDQSSVKAAKLALTGYDPTGQALFYWNPAKTTNKWIWSRPVIKKIGGHVFAR